MKKIKFLTKSNLSEYIPEDQQLVIWGGKIIIAISIDITMPMNKKNKSLQKWSYWANDFIGKDEWEYEFIEEDLTSFNNQFKNTINTNVSEQERNSSIDKRPKSLHLINGESSELIPDGDGRKKSVTFARTSPTPSNTSSQITPNTPTYGSPGKMLSIFV